MALKLDRNVNLEEINSDALLGIDVLQHQTLKQKIILFGSVILGVGLFLGTFLIFHTPVILSIFIMLLLGGIGVLFGANQSEHMTLAGYLKLIFFKPVKFMSFKSTEDVFLMKEEAKKLKEEEDLKLKQAATATPEEQRKLLVKLVVGLLVGLLFIGTLFGIAMYKKSNTKHHTVETSYVIEQLYDA